MKILFVSAVFPYPPRSGGQVRIYKLLKAAAQHHQITLFSFIRVRPETADLDKLNFCRKVEVVWRGRALQPRYIISSLLGKYPLLLTTYNHAALRERLTEELSRETYDLVHIEPFYVFPVLPKLTIPLVVAEHNIEYEVYENYARNYPISLLRPLMRFDAARIKQYEEQIWRQADQIITVSPDDQQRIAERAGNVPIAVVENGVDPELFTVAEEKIRSSAPRFLFVGNFSWLPNQEAGNTLLEEIWPTLKRAYPNSSLTIVGRNVSDGFRRRANELKVRVLEDVKDIVAEYHRADIFLAPMSIGGGSKYKIIEAMASGIPVVATESATAGLAIEPGKHYLRAGIATEYVKQVQRLLLDRSTRAKLVKAARTLVVARYSWSILSDKLLKVWQRVYEQNHS